MMLVHNAYWYLTKQLSFTWGDDGVWITSVLQNTKEKYNYKQKVSDGSQMSHGDFAI